MSTARTIERSSREERMERCSDGKEKVFCQHICAWVIQEMPERNRIETAAVKRYHKHDPSGQLYMDQIQHFLCEDSMISEWA
jgi:hypothetical protein